MKNYTRKEVDIDGSIEHFNSKGDYHRTDGPAVEMAYGSRSWYINGKLHRLDGPAVEHNINPNWAFPIIVKQWVLYGKEFYYQKEHNKLALFHILEPEFCSLE
jgi:hypothetical protein